MLRPLIALLVVFGLGCARGHFAATTSYATREVAGFRVYLSPEAQAAAESETLLAALEGNLASLAAGVRPSAYEALRAVPIWIERGPASGRAMAGYHGEPFVRAHGLNPEKARAVEIADAREFLQALKGPMPMALVHELAHAYYDRILGGEDEGVRNAYAAAVRSGRYERVRTHHGRAMRAYALESPAEYFAELTEAYVGTNDYEPFDRAALATFDPDGYGLMAATWQGR